MTQRIKTTTEKNSEILLKFLKNMIMFYKYLKQKGLTFKFNCVRLTGKLHNSSVDTFKTDALITYIDNSYHCEATDADIARKA